MFRNRVRTYALIGAVAVAGVLAAVLPALGDHDTTLDFIEFDATSGPAKFAHSDGVTTQSISTKRNSCEIEPLSGSLVVLSAGGGVPGFVTDSIGVRTNGPGANGTPCSQVQASESLVITAAAGIGSFSAVSLDLEMTGNAVVEVTFDGDAENAYRLHTGNAYHTLCASLQTGGAQWPGCAAENDPENQNPSVIHTSSGVFESACASPNSSGPNSGANDNCLWTVDPGIEFDEVKIAVVNGVGTVSLEGGADTGVTSKFYIAANAAPVANDQSVYFDYTEEPEGAPVKVEFDLDVSDPNDDSLQFTGIQSDVTGVGTFSLSGKTVTFTPVVDFTGSYSFTYTATDDGVPPLTSDPATVTIYELFTCTETLDVPPNSYGITGTYSRIAGEGCDAKPYVLDVELTPAAGTTEEIPSILFQPFPTDGDAVEDCSLLINDQINELCDDEFIGVFSFGPREPGNPANTGRLQYDPSDNDSFDFRTMRWCLQDPDADSEGQRPSPGDILPPPVDQQSDQGESWCIVSETTTVDGNGKTVTTWTVYGVGDPFKRLS